MKRLFALMIILIMVLSSCTITETTSKDNNDPSSSNESKITADQSTAEDLPEISFTESVVVDNEQCTIKITKFEEDIIWGTTLKVFLENKSADKKYMFAADALYVNGLEIEPLFATEVESGKKSNESLILTLSEEEEKELGTITEIEVKFRVYDSDEIMSDNVAEATAKIYPYGEDKAQKYTREDKSTDTVLVNNDSVKIIVIGYTEDEIWGYSANLYIENKTDKELMISADDVSVNGYMIDPFFATSVGSEKCRFADISWFTDAFEENEIEKVTDIEFNLRVYDSDNWEAKDVYNEKVTLKP